MSRIISKILYKITELENTHSGTARFPCGCFFLPSDFIFLPSDVLELVVNFLGVL